MFKKILIGTGVLLLAAIIIPFVWIGMGDKSFNDDIRALAPGQFAELSEGKLHYVWVEPAPETANGETVVMLHGLYIPHFMFAQNAEVLSDAGYRVLLPDHFGHGFSDRPGVKYDTAFFGAEVGELLTELDVDEPVYLAGQSTGGLIAAQFTAMHPEQVKGLVLIVPAGLRMHGEADDFISDVLRTPLVGEWFWRVVVRKALKGDWGPPCDECGTGPLLGDPYVQAEYRGYFPAMLNILRNYKLRDQDADYRALGETGVPTIAIFGDKDETVHIDSAGVLADLAPGIEIVILENADHAMNFRKSEVVTPLLLSFLAAQMPVAAGTVEDLPVATEAVLTLVAED